MRFLLLVIFFISCASTNRHWEVTGYIENPESIYFDHRSERIYVSSISGEGTKKDGKGHITVLKKNGQIIDAKWIKGLNAPKGMRSARGLLWVTDIDVVHAIDMESAKIVKTYRVKGAKFLNDVAIDRDVVYVSDTLTSKIHKIEKGVVSTFVSGKKYLSPNGLCVYKGDLYVASWGYTTDWSTNSLGHFYKINLKSKKMNIITKKPLGNLDGLEIDTDQSFIVSDWVAGNIYRIELSGKVKLLFNGEKGLADIGFIPGSRTVLVPYMLNNKVFNLKIK